MTLPQELAIADRLVVNTRFSSCDHWPKGAIPLPPSKRALQQLLESGFKVAHPAALQALWYPIESHVIAHPATTVWRIFLWLEGRHPHLITRALSSKVRFSVLEVQTGQPGLQVATEKHQAGPLGNGHVFINETHTEVHVTHSQVRMWYFDEVWFQRTALEDQLLHDDWFCRLLRPWRKSAS